MATRLQLETRGSLHPPERTSPLSGGILLRRFTVVSLLSTLAVGSIFGTIASQAAEDFALRSRTQAIAVYVSEFVAPRLAPEDFARGGSSQRIQFEFTVRDLLGRAGIVHVTVWNSRGQIVYRNAAASAAHTSARPPEVDHALIGEIGARYVRSGPDAPAGSRRMEVFVPIRLSKDGALVGAYQVVADATDLWAVIARLKLTVWESVVLGILVLYLVLFTIVRRASDDLGRQQGELRRAFIGTIESLVRAVDARDMATANHSTRVAEYAEAIAREMHLGEDAVQEIRVAGFLHDVGKIGIRDDILAKKRALTEQQWAKMRHHPVMGYEILQPVPIPESIRLAVLHSHEAWDGGGYPRGLAGDQIPLAARVVAVADAYEVLTKGRPYQPARSQADAAEEIARRAGVQFDPWVVEALHRAIRSGPAEGWPAHPETSARPQA